MPLYNKGADVVRAVNSVLRQTERDFELIVINDGSTDNGPELVRQFSDPRIRIIDQENGGVSAARNKGIREAKSDIIAFLDADDEWEAGFLEAIFSLAARFPECSVFATGYVYRDQNGTVRKPIIKGLPEKPWHGVLEDYFKVAAHSDPPLCTSAIAVKKESLLSVGCFPEGVTSGEDLLTWARLAVRHYIAYDSSCYAIFVQRAKRYEKPTRVPQSPDKVVAGFMELLPWVSPEVRGSLRQYIAWWHKNRASMYLRLGQRGNAFHEVLKMGYFYANVKLIFYLICLLLPKAFISKIFLLKTKK